MANSVLFILLCYAVRRRCQELSCPESAAHSGLTADFADFSNSGLSASCYLLSAICYRFPSFFLRFALRRSAVRIAVRLGVRFGGRFRWRNDRRLLGSKIWELSPLLANSGLLRIGPASELAEKLTSTES
jgi:hypothetical protein